MGKQNILALSLDALTSMNGGTNQRYVTPDQLMTATQIIMTQNLSLLIHELIEYLDDLQVENNIKQFQDKMIDAIFQTNPIQALKLKQEPHLL